MTDAVVFFLCPLVVIMSPFIIIYTAMAVVEIIEAVKK